MTFHTLGRKTCPCWYFNYVTVEPLLTARRLSTMDTFFSSWWTENPYIDFSTMATSLQRILSSIPKVAVVERLNYICTFLCHCCTFQLIFVLFVTFSAVFTLISLFQAIWTYCWNFTLTGPWNLTIMNLYITNSSL